MLLILGQGFAGTHLAVTARTNGHEVIGVRRTAGIGLLDFDDPRLPDLIQQATHILVSTPPERETGNDPMLARFQAALTKRKGWLGYLSSTGVYGDRNGAHVDEHTPIGAGRRSARIQADLAYQQIGACVFRLPGIYGPGRSALDQARAGGGVRFDAPHIRFDRIHVADIAQAVMLAMQAQATGIFNVTDDLPATPSEVRAFACQLLNLTPPPVQPLDLNALSPMARGFWEERRQSANGRIKRILGFRPIYPDYKAGLMAIHQEEEA